MPRGANIYDEARIQGRNRANANALNVVSPGIVTDDLLIYMDAGNRASYPASGTWWYDVGGMGWRGENLGTVDFDISGTGCLDYTYNSGRTIIYDFTPPKPELSVFAWVNADSLSSGTTGDGNPLFQFIVSTRTPVGQDPNEINAFTLYTRNKIITFVLYKSDGTVVYNSFLNATETNTAELQINTWYYVGFRTTGINNGPAESFVNSVKETYGTLLSDRGIGKKPLVIGGHFTGGIAGGALNINWDGKIGSVAIYNKYLTNDEILQNYNATKARYV